MSDLLRAPAGSTRTAQDAPATTSTGQGVEPRRSVPGIRGPIEVWESRQAREAEKEAARRAESESSSADQGRTSASETIRRRPIEHRTQPTTAQPLPVREQGQATFSRQIPTPARTQYDPSPPHPGDIGQAGWPSTRSYAPQQQSPQQQRAGASAQSHPVIAPVLSNTTQQRTTGATFPHTFERWEELSSHWEGLTAYWVHRLEEEAKKIRDEITVQQMSRQIADLNSAGAGLFNAVVELQKLRLSAERKFNRWYYQVRDDQERDQAEIERLRQALKEEENRRLNEPQVNVDLVEARLRELRRETQIAQAESQRSWEAVGRREDDDRRAMAQLRAGQPCYIGGIQVVPVPTSVSHGSGQVIHSQQHNPAYSTYPPMPGAQGFEQDYEPEKPSPTDTDPFSGQPAPQLGRPHTAGGFQPFPSGPSPPPIGSMRNIVQGPSSQTYPGMSPAESRGPQGHSRMPIQQYPFPNPGRMPPGPMPVYTQAGQYLHQQMLSTSSQAPQRQQQQQQEAYLESGNTSVVEDDDDEGYGLELDPPPPISESMQGQPAYPEHERYQQDERQQESGSPEHYYAAGIEPGPQDPHRGGLYLQYQPTVQHSQAPYQPSHLEHHNAPRNIPYTYDLPNPSSASIPRQPGAPYTTAPSTHHHPHLPPLNTTATSYNPTYSPTSPFQSPSPSDSPQSPASPDLDSGPQGPQVQGQGYGLSSAAPAGDWEGMQAHAHHATRLSDVLEEESVASPSGSRSRAGTERGSWGGAAGGGGGAGEGRAVSGGAVGGGSGSGAGANAGMARGGVGRRASG